MYISVCVFSGVRLFATLLMTAGQASLPVRISGKNTEMGCHSLLQRIFLTQ